jgi:acyl carrier protein
MMPSPEAVTHSVFSAFEEFNADESGPRVPSRDTVLLGEGGVVDSLGLVRLILLVESRIEGDFGSAVSLTDEKAMSQRTSPFRTLGTLADYITRELSPQ